MLAIGATKQKQAAFGFTAGMARIGTNAETQSTANMNKTKVEYLSLSLVTEIYYRLVHPRTRITERTVDTFECTTGKTTDGPYEGSTSTAALCLTTVDDPFPSRPMETWWPLVLRIIVEMDGGKDASESTDGIHLRGPKLAVTY